VASGTLLEYGALPNWRDKSISHIVLIGRLSNKAVVGPIGLEPLAEIAETVV
jgi:hypothetical protein